MKKLINNPADYVDEMLAGLTMAHPALVLDGENKRVVRRAAGARMGKVGIASGGGSGHLPFFTGFVGRGLIDTCAIGNVFEGPALQSCTDAVRLADGGSGVLQLIGNYGGERMNFGMVSEIVADEGIATRTVLGTDDIASAGVDEISRRRGVAGLIFAYKAAGASSERGDDLNTVAAAAELAIARTRTIGVALGPCRVPGADRPSFTLGEDEIEMGMGIHGEPGIWRAKMRSADAIVDEMLERLFAERPTDHNGRVVVLVNSLGATPLEELFILYRRVATVLADHRLTIAHADIGPFATSMEMAGASITLCFLNDELEELLAAPADCPFWRIA